MPDEMLGLVERLHVLHRAWRYRLRSERDEMAFLFARRARLAGTTLVDIGAYHGIYSYWMHRLAGAGGRVIAFEPQPEMARYLGALKSGFHLDRLTIVNAGLSSSAGQMKLTRPAGHWGGASLERGRGNAAMESITVRVTTLDEYFAENPGPRVGFIKCDVEGHEFDVFEGARVMLAEHRPELLIECHDAKVREGRLIASLEYMGYRAHFFHRHRLVSMERWAELRPRIAKPYLNYVFSCDEIFHR